jgi:hypothetical protein
MCPTMAKSMQETETLSNLARAATKTTIRASAH